MPKQMQPEPMTGFASSYRDKRPIALQIPKIQNNFDKMTIPSQSEYRKMSKLDANDVIQTKNDTKMSNNEALMAFVSIAEGEEEEVNDE